MTTGAYMLWYRMLPKDCSLLAGSVCRICRHCSSQATTSLWNRTAPRHRSVALTSVCRDISCCSNNLAQAGIVTDEDEAEDDVGRGVLMGKEPWEKSVFDAVSGVLAAPERADLELYSFRTETSKRVDVRLDKLTDVYGSPSLEDIKDVARKVNALLEETLGEEASGEIEGAERLLQWDEISRFRELPIVISFTAQTDGKTETMTRVLEVEELDKEGDAAVWRLADVKGNSPGKGKAVSKRMKEQRWKIGKGDVKTMQLYIDV